MPQTPVYGFSPATGTPVPSVTKRSQLSVESTPGVATSTWKRMPTLMITPGPKIEVQKFRGQGYKYPSQVVEGKEWVTGKYEGAATYAELAYILSSYGKMPTPTLQGTTGYKWSFNPDTSNPDSGKTYTIQHGDSTGGWSLTYGQFASVTFNLTRDAVKVSGDLIGQYWTTGATLGASPTVIENVPIIPNTVNISLDTAFGSLGTTQLKNAFEIEVGLPNKFAPVFPVNTGAPGHAGTVEIPTEPTLKMKLAADTQSDGLITQLRAAGLYYVQIQCISTLQVDSAAPTMYALMWSFPVQLGDSGGFSDQNGVYVADWTENIVVDGTNNFVWKADLYNKLSAL